MAKALSHRENASHSSMQYVQKATKRSGRPSDARTPTRPRLRARISAPATDSAAAEAIGANAVAALKAQGAAEYIG